MDTQRWPQLTIADWEETRASLHLWTQIVGKVRLRLEPMQNHGWNVTLYVTPRGLTTSLMPYAGERFFSIDFDFIHHHLTIDGCDGERGGFQLEPMTVADFYRRLMSELNRLGYPVTISKKPNELADAVPFESDTVRRAYDRQAATNFARALVQADRVCKIFRARFLGKSSPVHFFWGSFDLAVTRFSGRTAPPHPGGFPNMPDAAMREAYSHEEFSCGMWFGGGGAEAMFYAYAYPTPEGFDGARVSPAAASWNDTLREFVLPYDDVRRANDRDGDLLAFFQSTYEAAAAGLHWDRTAFERAR